MGCGSSVEKDGPKPQPQVLPPQQQQQHQQAPRQGVPVAQPAGAGAAQRPAGGQGNPATASAQGSIPQGVDDALAKGFITALREEYLQGKDQAVGTYFGKQGVPVNVQNLLDPYEERVRSASNKQAEISALEAEWTKKPQIAGNLAPSAATAGQVAQGPKPQGVDDAVANGFIAALREEYLQGKAEAVEMYYKRQAVPVNVQNLLTPYEDRLRLALDKQAEISVLEAEWTKKPQFTAIGKSIAEHVAEIKTALKLPESTGNQSVAFQGMKANDLEVVRKALNVAFNTKPHVGLDDPKVKLAEERIKKEKQLPADWDIAAYSTGRFLQGGEGGRKDSTVIAFKKEQGGVVDDIQYLFDKTYRKVYTRDRRGAPIPDKFLVKEVHRVMNDQVWREYVDRRAQVKKRLAGNKPQVPEGTETGNQLASKSKASLPKLDSSVNEQWLFHGTTAVAAMGISENDFRLDLTGSNAGTLYGKGVYLAENASKSDEYGEGPKGPANSEEQEPGDGPRPPPGPPPPLVRESYILLCRSICGKVNYTDEQRPDPDKLQKSCLDGGFDSVLGDRRKRNGTFRELVVYNDDHVYPEYVVTYERVFFHERFAEIYEDMCTRKVYNGPTEEEKGVLASLWGVFSNPHKGKINKWQLLDLLVAINQPPKNEGEDLDATFKQWTSNQKIEEKEFFAEMDQRVRDKRAGLT